MANVQKNTPNVVNPISETIEKTTSSETTTTTKSKINLNFDISPATLEALKTLSTISSNEGIEKLSECDKLAASLEQIRANKNMKLFEKLDKIRQDFSGLNHKIAQMEESIVNLRETTNDLVKSLPPDRDDGDEVISDNS